MARAARKKGFDPIDVHVGRRIRMKRQAAGIPQVLLADLIGVTFQQVQKYERGSNRVSASRLYQIAQVLCLGAVMLHSQLVSARHLAVTAEGLLQVWLLVAQIDTVCPGPSVQSVAKSKTAQRLKRPLKPVTWREAEAVTPPSAPRRFRRRRVGGCLPGSRQTHP
jgi:DNA-binding XRE family transcriptional regulator